MTSLKIDLSLSVILSFQKRGERARDKLQFISISLFSCVVRLFLLKNRHHVINKYYPIAVNHRVFYPFVFLPLSGSGGAGVAKQHCAKTSVIFLRIGTRGGRNEAVLFIH
jgi:hypothetical protein